MTVLELFLTFLKIGAFTFGGGYSMLPLIQQAVASHGWLDSTDLINFIAISESTPGPFAVNIATFVGMKVGGLFGSFCATLGIVLPSFIIILLVAKCYEKFKTSKGVSGCMYGLKPAVVGLIGSAVISIGKTVFFPSGFSASVFMTPVFWVSLAALAVFAFLAFKKVNPIFIICISAAFGIAAGYILDIPV